MPQQDRRRAPAVLKAIEDIDAEADTRVRIVGTVLEVRGDSIMVDDGSGTVEVFLDTEDVEDVDDGQRVRVIGRVLPLPSGFEVQGEIVQDFSDVDMELYGKVREAVGDRLMQ